MMQRTDPAEPIDVDLYRRKAPSWEVDLTHATDTGRLLVGIADGRAYVVIDLAEAREVYAALGEALAVVDARGGEVRA